MTSRSRQAAYSIYHTKSPLTIYKQMHKGNVRLNIDVHGSPYKSGQGGLCVGDALYSPGMLRIFMKGDHSITSIEIG